MQTDGRIEVFDGRGYWVPDGLSVSDIARGAQRLAQDFDVPNYIAQAMVIAVLEEIRAIAPCSQRQAGEGEG